MQTNVTIKGTYLFLFEDEIYICKKHINGIYSAL